MQEYIVPAAVAVIAGLVAFILGQYLAKRAAEKQLTDAKQEASRIVTEADKEAKIKLKRSKLAKSG